jgi:hypothetical protein
VLTRGEAPLRDGCSRSTLGFSRTETQVRDERALGDVSDPLSIERSRRLGTSASDGGEPRRAAGSEDEDIEKSRGEERRLVEN